VPSGTPASCNEHPRGRLLRLAEDPADSRRRKFRLRHESGRSVRVCWTASAMLEATPTTVKPSRSRRRLADSRKA
jgi:hypothetical protein